MSALYVVAAVAVYCGGFMVASWLQAMPAEPDDIGPRVFVSLMWPMVAAGVVLVLPLVGVWAAGYWFTEQLDRKS